MTPLEKLSLQRHRLMDLREKINFRTCSTLTSEASALSPWKMDEIGNWVLETGDLLDELDSLTQKTVAAIDERIGELQLEAGTQWTWRCAACDRAVMVKEASQAVRFKACPLCEHRPCHALWRLWPEGAPENEVNW